jgi:O-acetyl-ADP-ribose deacetylase (regulator of RNase III)
LTRGKVVIKQGDITGEAVDAIVNAANTELQLGAGVAGAIRRKGGPTIQQECDAVAPVPLGEAATTTGGNLKARYVIHAASMSLGGPLTTENSLRDSVKNSLLRAEEKGLKSVAFPAIGTGVAGFPVARCAEVMIEEVRRFLEKETSVEEVGLVLFDAQTLEAFRRAYEKKPRAR